MARLLLIYLCAHDSKCEGPLLYRWDKLRKCNCGTLRKCRSPAQLYFVATCAAYIKSTIVRRTPFVQVDTRMIRLMLLISFLCDDGLLFDNIKTQHDRVLSKPLPLLFSQRMDVSIAKVHF